MSPPNSFSKNNLNDTTDNLKLPQLEMKRNVWPQNTIILHSIKWLLSI